MKPGAEGKTNMDGTPQSPDQTAPICDPSRCTGCCACLNACERDAISMAPDDEGFLRPAIDAEKCVRCGRCAKVCPQNTPPEVPDELKTAYAWRTKYLRRLRREGTDESYIEAYKKAWNLSEDDLREEEE